MKLEDQRRDPAEHDVEVDKIFRQQYLAKLGGPPPYVCLESKDFVYGIAPSTYYAHFHASGMHKNGQRCTDLLEKTANSLSGSVVATILLAVQRDNLELNITQAVKWYDLVYSGTKMKSRFSNFSSRVHSASQRGDLETKKVIELCILAFPSIWVSRNAHVLGGGGLPLKPENFLVLRQSVRAHLCHTILSSRSTVYHSLDCIDVLMCPTHCAVQDVCAIHLLVFPCLDLLLPPMLFRK